VLYTAYGCPLIGNDVKVKYLLTSRHHIIEFSPFMEDEDKDVDRKVID